jgi:DNA-binding NarL/FixJ family response regulator
MSTGQAGGRIFVVCDNASIRRSVREIINQQPDLQVVGEAVDGPGLLSRAPDLDPDLVVIDFTLPGINGLAATRILKDRMPHVQVILLTTFDVQPLREAAISSGASGCMVKTSVVEELLPAVRSLLDDIGQRGSKDRSAEADRAGGG